MKLAKLYAVVSELRLHTNLAIGKDIAKHYNAKLYEWSDAAPFLTASLESMMQVFYIELDGFIGAFWNSQHTKVQQRQNESGSLARYLYLTERSVIKKRATELFESLLKEKWKELAMIHDARGKLGHFTALSERNSAYIPNDIDTREILDKLAEVLYLLGYQPGNKPHYIAVDNNHVASTQYVIDRIVKDKETVNMREKYNLARKDWFKSKL